MTNDNHVILAGLDDDEEMIFFPRQVEEGPDGNLYVLDAGDSFIKVFSPAGQYLDKMGGQGEGPGEFQRIDGATFGFTADDNLFFTEYMGGHRWITVMDLDGNLVDVLSPQLEVMFGVESTVSLDDGGFLVQFRYNSQTQAKADYFLYDKPQSLVRLDSLGAIVSEITSANFTSLISYSPNGGTTNLPFIPVFAWTSTGDNEVIWSDGMSPRLQVFNYSGKLIREIETPFPQPGKVSASDLEQWKRDREEQMKSLDPVWWERLGRVIYEYKKPLYDMPILRSISTTPSGNLLVKGRNNADTGEWDYWLLDRQGHELKSVSASAWGVHFSDHYLLFVTYDEEGSPHVHAVEHFGDEVTALAKMEVGMEPMIESGRQVGK